MNKKKSNSADNSYTYEHDTSFNTFSHLGTTTFSSSDNSGISNNERIYFNNPTYPTFKYYIGFIIYLLILLLVVGMFYYGFYSINITSDNLFNPIVYFLDPVTIFLLLLSSFLLSLVLLVRMFIHEEPKFTFSRKEVFFSRLLIAFTIVSFVLELINSILFVSKFKTFEIQLLETFTLIVLLPLTQIIIFVVIYVTLLIMLPIFVLETKFIEKSNKEFGITKEFRLLKKSSTKKFSINDIRNGEIKYKSGGKNNPGSNSLYLHLKTGKNIHIVSEPIPIGPKLAYISLLLVKYVGIPINLTTSHFRESTLNPLTPSIIDKRFIFSDYILKHSEALFSSITTWTVETKSSSTIFTSLKNKGKYPIHVNELMYLIVLPFMYISCILYLNSKNYISFDFQGLLLQLMFLTLPFFLILAGIDAIYQGIGYSVIIIESDGMIAGHTVFSKNTFSRKWFYELIEDIIVEQKNLEYRVMLKYYLSSEPLATFQDYHSAIIFRSFLMKSILQSSPVSNIH